MDDLVQWLGEQLDADAAHARKDLWAAERATQGRWRARYGVNLDHSWIETEASPVLRLDGARHEADALLVARHQPETVRKRAEVKLREIDAKRRVLARHCAAPVPPGTEWMEAYPYCAAHAYEEPGGTVVYPIELKDCPELRDLAAPYADRPGYLEKWRP